MTNTRVLDRPLISITNVIFSFDAPTKQLLILMLKRSLGPSAGSWGLPTTSLRTDESADAAAIRLVREKLGVTLARFQTEQLGTFTAVERVAGERRLALTYMVYLPVKPALVPGAGAQDARWFAVTPVQDRDDLVNGPLAFTGLVDSVSPETFYQGGVQKSPLTADHALIIKTALTRVRNRLDYAPTILNVLGKTFTLKQAREVYAVLKRTRVDRIDNSNFRKTHGHLFNEVGVAHVPGSGRPAKIYQLKEPS